MQGLSSASREMPDHVAKAREEIEYLRSRSPPRRFRCPDCRLTDGDFGDEKLLRESVYRLRATAAPLGERLPVASLCTRRCPL
jgi:hypothetical protein